MGTFLYVLVLNKSYEKHTPSLLYFLLRRWRSAVRGCQVSSGLVIIRSLHFIFVFSELCLLSHGLLPLPSLGVPYTSTPTPGASSTTGVPTPCNSHNDGSSLDLEFFTQVRLYLLDLGLHSHELRHLAVPLSSPERLLPSPRPSRRPQGCPQTATTLREFRSTLGLQSF